MKLYTEEQVIRAIELSFGRSEDEVLAGLTPIELPSDEEIEREAIDENIYNNLQFRKGAKWVINKIQGGNK